MNWRAVFERWLRDHPALDRIEFADVAYDTWQGRSKAYVGPIVVVTR